MRTSVGCRDCRPPAAPKSKNGIEALINVPALSLERRDVLVPQAEIDVMLSRISRCR